MTHVAASIEVEAALGANLGPTTASGGRGGASRFGVVALMTFAGLLNACSERRSVEVKGWPRVTGLRSVSSAPAAPDSPVPPRPRLADVASLMRGAGEEKTSDAGADDLGPDASASDTMNIRTWSGMSVCDRLVETACVYLGVHSQECAEIRGWRRLTTTQETLNECQAILDQFDMTYNQPGIRRVRNPCWSLAYDICDQQGRTSQACQEARDEARRMRSPELRRACKGGILVYEVKKAFPSWGPNALPRVIRP